MSKSIFDIEILGGAMRPMKLEKTFVHGETFRLSRGERDYVAGHALASVGDEARELGRLARYEVDDLKGASSVARRITALSNLLGDIGWEREAAQDGGTGMPVPSWFLGELFPIAQLRPWLGQWTEEDLSISHNTAADGAFATLGTGWLLLARLEKWMASHGN